MARAGRQGRTPEQWTDLGREAILDLLGERFVVPWAEAEARISLRGWKSFDRIQPVQLEGARKSLVSGGLIIQEATEHHPPVVTVRLPYPEGKAREYSRLRGSRRKQYRKYMDWAGNQTLCGKHAERVVLASAHAAASGAALHVPPQTVGRIEEVKGVPLSRGPLDCLAHVLRLPDLDASMPMVFEVKNVHSWLYQYSREVWELLVKAADVAVKTPVMPVLVCVKAAWQTGQLAKDTGFLVCQFGSQLFSPTIDQQQFDSVVDEFALVIQRHDGPLDSVVGFLDKVIRLSPPPSPPEQDIPWYKRQVERFQALAPLILKFEGLAGTLVGTRRRNVFEAFRKAAKGAFGWPSVGGW